MLSWCQAGLPKDVLFLMERTEYYPTNRWSIELQVAQVSIRETTGPTVDFTEHITIKLRLTIECLRKCRIFHSIANNVITYHTQQSDIFY